MSLAASTAVLYALFVWWLSTGLVLLVVRLPRPAHGWIMLAATVVMLLAMLGLRATGGEEGTAYAFCAFTCAVLVWAWQEIGFLLGLVTGPRKAPLSAGASGRRRFAQATAAILHHELALLIVGVSVFALTFGGNNEVGWWTFAVLWIMRLSAKLNLFLGVPNRSEEFLPAHLRYLASYFAHAPMNLLFPLSITAATAAAALLVAQAIDPATGAAATAGLTLVIVLLALAIIEHWFMVLPIPAAVLWRWGLGSAADPSPDRSVSAAPRGKRATAWPPGPLSLALAPAAGPVDEPATTTLRRGS